MSIIFTLVSCGGGDSTPAPEPPEILSTNASGFSFSWMDNGEDLLVEISEQNDFSSIAFDSLYASSPAVVSGLKSGTTYFVRAQHPSISSPFTEAMEVMTNNLTVPGDFQVAEIFGDSFKLSWNEVPGATYTIDVAFDQAFTNFVEGYNGRAVTANQVVVDVPQIETTYYYRLKAVNGDQSSAFSTTGNATTNDRIVFRFSSSAFSNGGKIPQIYACNGPSPPLEWKNPPQGTRTLVLIMDDLDFRNGVYNHWVIFNISASSRGLAAGASGPNIPIGIEASNQLGQVGYFGPCPPANETHRYEFTLYALDNTLNFQQNAFKTVILPAMDGHILAKKTIIGLFN